MGPAMVDRQREIFKTLTLKGRENEAAIWTVGRISILPVDDDDYNIYIVLVLIVNFIILCLILISYTLIS